MKDYKRLTDRVTAEMLRNTEGESWDSDNIEAQCYIRLAELEDKIESGEIDYVSDKDAEIACLTAENAALRERLGKAVNKRVVANMLAKYFDCPCNFSPIDEEMFDFCNECCNDNVICWEKVIEKNIAEARLAELNGGKNE